MPPEHGEYDSAQQKWFCGYWMSQAEWLDIHDYAPTTTTTTTTTTTAIEKEQEDGDGDDDGVEEEREQE
jgi:hypothetical protein